MQEPSSRATWAGRDGNRNQRYHNKSFKVQEFLDKNAVLALCKQSTTTLSVPACCGRENKENRMDAIIVLATGNHHKYKEMQQALRGLPFSMQSLADFAPLAEPVEDGTTFAENAWKKARHYAKALGLPCLADDSGLVVDGLGGRPGVLTARYAGPAATDGENCQKLLAEMAGLEHRVAHFVSVLALATPTGQALTWEGRCDGLIISDPRGTTGFGYDPLFLFPEIGLTFAEISAEQKSAFSHRGRALATFTAQFAATLTWLGQQMAAPQSGPLPR